MFSFLYKASICFKIIQLLSRFFPLNLPDNTNWLTIPVVCITVVQVILHKKNLHPCQPSCDPPMIGLLLSLKKICRETF